MWADYKEKVNLNIDKACFLHYSFEYNGLVSDFSKLLNFL